jgi:hypothetical protein
MQEEVINILDQIFDAIAFLWSSGADIQTI